MNTSDWVGNVIYWLGAVASVLGIISFVVTVTRRYPRHDERQPTSRPMRPARAKYSLSGLVFLVILLTVVVVADGIVARVYALNTVSSALSSCYSPDSGGSTRSCILDAEIPVLSDFIVLSIFGFVATFFAMMSGTILATQNRSWGWFGLFNQTFVLSCALFATSFQYQPLINDICYYDGYSSTMTCLQETVSIPHQDWIIYAANICFILALILAVIIWVFGLIRAGRAQHWWWFTCIMLTGPLGAMLYSIFGLRRA